jgi:hypothetical protein
MPQISSKCLRQTSDSYTWVRIFSAVERISIPRYGFAGVDKPLALGKLFFTVDGAGLKFLVNPAFCRSQTFILSVQRTYTG